MSAPLARVRPGDFAVVLGGTQTTRLITAAEKLEDMVRPTGLKWTDWDHALLCTSVQDRAPGVYLNGIGGGSQKARIVEAEPAGATEADWHYNQVPFAWSSGIIELTDRQRDVIVSTALRLAREKTGYGWLDYAALTAHALRVPVPGLRDFISDSHRLICSQLVDYCYQQAGVQLFNDSRWNGYVTPSDLGALLVP